MANYYLATSFELSESNIGVLKDGRDASERLQTLLQEYFDDITIKVLSIEAKDEYAMEARCSREPFGDDDTPDEFFTVKLERTFIY